MNVEWVDEPVTSSNVLKLIYQGRFLHGSVSIGGNQYSTNNTVVCC